MRDNIVYLIRKKFSFLMGLYDPAGFKISIDVDKSMPRYSLYKFDAAKIPKLSKARQILNYLTVIRGETDLSIVKFNVLNGEVTEI